MAHDLPVGLQVTACFNDEDFVRRICDTAPLPVMKENEHQQTNIPITIVVPNSFLILLVRHLLLVAMPFARSSVLLLLMIVFFLM